MTIRLLKHIIRDLLRTRFVLVYFLLLLVGSLLLFGIESDSGKVMVSQLNIVLMVVPLVSVVYSTIHFHNAYDFISLMVTQPIRRRIVFIAEFLAVGLSLSLAFILGIGIPMLVYQVIEQGLLLLLAGTFLTLVFTALAFVVSVFTADKARAIGLALLFWFWFSVLYDGLLMLILYWLSDYPVEQLIVGLISLNPIDLARITVLLKLDYAALMGYTSAFYRDFFGGTSGIIFSLTILSVWLAIPLWISLKIFERKDL